MLPTSPIPRRSSGIKPIRMPLWMMSRGVLPTRFSPSKKMRPLSGRMRPAMASHSSFCPLLATPATPRISYFRRSKLTSDTALFPSASRTVTSSSRSSDCCRPRSTSGFTIARSIFLPTIISMRFGISTSAVCTVPTDAPFRRTVTRSEISITSFSLWVMMMTEHPCCFMFRMMRNSLRISCGVSTAVGSSMIRIRAPRYSTLRISSVCFSPTDISETRLSGSMSSP